VYVFLRSVLIPYPTLPSLFAAIFIFVSYVYYMSGLHYRLVLDALPFGMWVLSYSLVYGDGDGDSIL